jgi:L,D-transpeptidase YcbB
MIRFSLSQVPLFLSATMLPSPAVSFIRPRRGFIRVTAVVSLSLSLFCCATLQTSLATEVSTEISQIPAPEVSVQTSQVPAPEGSTETPQGPAPEVSTEIPQDPANEVSLQISQALAAHLKYSTEQLEAIESFVPLIASRDRCLSAVYHATGNIPLWVNDNGPSERAAIARSYLHAAAAEGLRPEDYGVEEIDRLWSSLDSQDLALLDTLLTYNLLLYAHDVSYGQYESYSTNPKIFFDTGRQDFDPLRTIKSIIADPDLTAHLATLPPTHQHYRALKDALRTYRQLAAAGGWTSLPAGPSLRPGEIDPRVPAIRIRLNITGDLEHIDKSDTFYDQSLKVAVMKFQKRYGLEADGIIGAQTVAAMNIPAKRLVSQIIVNMTRWRWQAHDLGEKYVLVNIAGYNLHAVKNGDTVMEMPVIVGEMENQTPIFSDRIQYLDFNPFWVITQNIASKEELPRLQQNPRYLVDRNVRLFSSWDADAVEIDSTRVDWKSITPAQMARYKLRQDPGPLNALGRVKFVFPNRFAIYMHDTPKRDLFSQSARNFSHGCIRVSNPLALAAFALEEEKKGWTEEKIKETIDTGRRKIVQLTTPLSVHLTYQTTWVDKEGSIHFNRDVYGRDTELSLALLGENQPMRN